MPAVIYIGLSVLPIGAAINPQLRYSNYVLPGILAMTIMQGGIYGLAYWMTDLKALGVIKRFLVTPLKMWQLIIAVVGARLVLIFSQVIILTLIGMAIFHAQFSGNIVSTIILVFLGGSIFLLVGLLIANYATSYDTAAPITTGIGLPLTFLGNIFYPISLLPHGLRIFAELLPITYLADGLRQAYLYPFNFAVIGKNILVLAIWLVGMLIVTISLFRLKE